MPSSSRPAAVAGLFYPAEPAALRTQIARNLAAADERAARPKLLIAPHAGYRYSGAVAAHAYATLAGAAIERIVLLGPSHRVALNGLAAPATHTAFATPLGRIDIDQQALAALDDLPQVTRDDLPHALEHSLEVQLPFLQQVLGQRFALVPLVVGDADPHEVAQVIERLWGGDETLIVVSSDLSHYLPYEQACARDRRTVHRIVEFDASIAPHDACGAHAIDGALVAARAHGLEPSLLDLCNSGDTAGDRRSVVGYGSIAFESSR